MDGLVCIQDFADRASPRWPVSVRAYYEGGADDEITLRENEKAYKRLQLIPRVLRGVSEVDLSTRVLGHPVAFPVGISPAAHQRLVWPDGEVSVAKGAAAMNTCYIVSAATMSTMEEIVSNVPGGLRWFQLYVSTDRSWTEKIVRNAAATGFKALVLTVDSPLSGTRRGSLRSPLNLPAHLKLHYVSNVVSRGIPNPYNDMSLTFKDIAWLKKVSGLPVIVKGILSPDDARLAVEHGAAAILVSNHGGRQLDTVPATIDVLPEIVEAVAGRVEVYVDGGIRTGTDVIKALAMGARAVFVGRPIIWGLSVQGAAGVTKVLDILQQELNTAMALCGVRRITDINKTLVRKRITSSI